MQNAGRLVRAPVGVDVGSAFQQESRNLKLPVHARPGQRHVQDMLVVGGSPMQVPQNERVVGGVMLTKASQLRLACLVKPTSHPREVPCACRVAEIVG